MQPEPQVLAISRDEYRSAEVGRVKDAFRAFGHGPERDAPRSDVPRPALVARLRASGGGHPEAFHAQQLGVRP